MVQSHSNSSYSSIVQIKHVLPLPTVYIQKERSHFEKKNIEDVNEERKKFWAMSPCFNRGQSFRADNKLKFPSTLDIRLLSTWLKDAYSQEHYWPLVGK